jgi:hypothetical protein
MFVVAGRKALAHRGRQQLPPHIAFADRYVLDLCLAPTV